MSGHPTYRESHPLPAVLMHWTHLISIVGLTFTGFYIHYPFFGGAGVMNLMRYIHFILMYALVINLVVRVYWAFFGKGSATMKGTRETTRDYKNFGMDPVNKGQFFETIKYYLFLRKTHPLTAKFNSLQKLVYVFWAFLILAQAYTGFAIYGVTDQLKFFSFGTDLVGGLMVMRTVHYFIMWVFILTTMIHVYLSVAEDVDALPLMFLWKEKVPKGGHEASTGASKAS